MLLIAVSVLVFIGIPVLYAIGLSRPGEG